MPTVALWFMIFVNLRNVICNETIVRNMRVGKGHTMKGIFLPGYACSSYIWAPIKNKIKKSFKGKLIDWPKEKIKKYNSINDFANWVSKEYLYGDDIDYLVGHSMGGLVSLNIAEKSNKIKRVILIESYLYTPSHFFRNIVMGNTSEIIKNNILKMLEKEKDNYSQILKNSLRDINMMSLIDRVKCDINLIYGDRGINDKNKIISELKLAPTMFSKLNIRIVKNTCHFPMIENPEETKIILSELLT